MEPNSIGSMVGRFCHGDSEVGDGSGAWSVESEPTKLEASLGDEQGVWWKRCFKLEQLADEVGHKIVGSIDEGAFPVFPVARHIVGQR